MSKIALSGNASGTGTLTIAAPNTSTDRTLTLPDNTGTVISTGSTAVVTNAMLAAGVAGNGPAFAAYLSSDQTGLSNYSNTRVTFQTEEFDTAGAFNNTGSTVGSAPAYSFNPQVAGYYQVNWCIQVPLPSSTALALGNLYKNGNAYKSGSVSLGNGSTYPTSTGSCLVYLNGSTDYVTVQAWGYQNGATFNIQNGVDRTFFSAAFVRSA